MRFFLFLLLICFVSGCSQSDPKRFSEEHRIPNIYPDYTSLTIPLNIAPLNFSIEESGDSYLTKISAENGSSIFVSGKIVDIPLNRWKKLLTENVGKDIRFDVFVCVESSWKKFDSIVNHVSQEPVDTWISYRLVEPLFNRYRDISLNQRNLETFEERAFYHNFSMIGDKGQCANCHSFQNRQTRNMLFHLRAFRGGTVFIRDGKPEKIDLKIDEIISAGTYPSWHPAENLVAFSVNKTQQYFHTLSTSKVEVIDIASDIILYDVDKNEISYIFVTPNDFETYPSWSQDGLRLYYCNAKLDVSTSDFEERRSQTVENYDKIKYDLMSVSFNPKTRNFGQPEIVVDAVSMNKSVAFPRLSSDGRFLIYTLSDFGCFPIWHQGSDLWLLDLKTGGNRCLTEVNSGNAESFHNWTSSGRWFVFSSRRDDGSYTRLYFSHIDETGRASKPFLLPQKRPEQNQELIKSYNVPEFMTEPVQVDVHALMKTVLEEQPRQAEFRQ